MLLQDMLKDPNLNPYSVLAEMDEMLSSAALKEKCDNKRVRMSNGQRTNSGKKDPKGSSDLAVPEGGIQ